MRATHFLTTALTLALTPFAIAQGAAPQSSGHPAPALVDPSQQYTQTNLVSNISGNAAVTDPNLVNPWGLSRASGSPWWVSDNGTGLSTLYSGTGSIVPLVVTIPPSDPKGGTKGSPTGTIFNGTNDFLAGGSPAAFLFATEDGTVSGWNGGSSAVLLINEGPTSVFKGLTMGQASLHGGPRANYLYVADFRKGMVAVYDTTYHHVTEIESAFSRIHVAGYAPFNVQNIGGDIYVTYAKQDAAKHDEVDGQGLGMVEAFYPEGGAMQSLQRGPWFNAPWGITAAPSDFGAYSHNILVGNFGSGQIAAFDPVNGRFKGVLRDSNNAPLWIDGLWALSFGSDGSAGKATSLYFSAGPNHEADGLLGMLTANSTPAGNDQ